MVYSVYVQARAGIPGESCAGPGVGFWCSLWVPPNSENLMNLWLWKWIYFQTGHSRFYVLPLTAPCCSQIPDVLPYSMVLWWDLCSWIDFLIVASWKHFLTSFLISWGNFHPLDSLSLPEPQAGLCREHEMWCGQAQLGLPVTSDTNPVVFPVKIPFQDFKWGILLWTRFFPNFSDVKEP